MHGEVEAQGAIAGGAARTRAGRSRRSQPVDEGTQATAGAGAGAARTNPSAWSDRAECRGADPKLFFPPPRCPPSEEAKAYCAQCPVSVECLEYAVSLRLAGIWGGTSETQRIKLRRARRERAGMGGDLRVEQRSSART